MAFRHPGAEKENPALIWLGHLFVVFGVIGILLPVVPTTPFLIVSLACYAKGSKRFYGWLVSHRLLGRYIKDFSNGRGAPLKAKIMLGISGWISMLISAVIFLRHNLVAATLVMLIPAGMSVYLILIPTRKGP